MVLVKTKAIPSFKKIMDPEKEKAALSETGLTAGVTGSRMVINKDFLKDIQKVKGKARNYLGVSNATGFKFPLMRAVSFIPNPLVERARQKMGEFIAEHDVAVNNLAANWENVKLEAKTRLGVLYDEEDYPEHPEERFKLEFVEFNITNVGANPMTEVVESFKSNTAVVLRNRMSDLFDSVVKGLTVQFEDDGTPKKGTLSNTMFEKLEEFVQLVQALDERLLDDKTIKEYVTMLNTIIRDEKGVLLDMNEVKKKGNLDFRIDLGDAMADIQDAFVAAIETDPIRDIDTDDDEE